MNAVNLRVSAVPPAAGGLGVIVANVTLPLSTPNPTRRHRRTAAAEPSGPSGSTSVRLNASRLASSRSPAARLERAVAVDVDVDGLLDELERGVGGDDVEGVERERAADLGQGAGEADRRGRRCGTGAEDELDLIGLPGEW